MDARETKYISARAADYFGKICVADSIESIMMLHKQLCDVINVKPTNFSDFFPKVMATITSSDAKDLLSKYQKRTSRKPYENGKACLGTKVLVIGAGPCGLRTAIEAQLLGAKVVVIEKRQNFSRNNVLHLWPFVIADLKGLGAKKFYGKFCPGAIDHISICQLQMILLKIALLLGAEVHFGVEFNGVTEPTDEGGKVRGWRAELKPENHELNKYEFDVLIGADGRRNTLKGFKRKVLRGKLAIAITANFVNKRSAAEAKVQEISGVSFIFKQDFFNELCAATGIDLENIVYYKDETHYFVMTAKKHSLLWKGVLHEDYAETEQLLAPDNIKKKALESYIVEAVNFSTNHKLPNLQFALNSRGEPDIALIDFTEMYQAENACRVMQRKGRKLLVGLVGDSLLEPFWPTGSGCARGFLSSLDMCWSIRSWTKKPKAPVEVIAERESIYRLLAQSTHENLSKDYSGYTVEPNTRYPYINLGSVKPYQVKNLFDSDELSKVEGHNGAAEKVAGNKTVGVVRGTNGTVQSKVSQKSVEVENKQHEDDLPDLEEMLSWFRSQVQPYGVKVEGIQDVYVNGHVLCAILHRFRPDLLPEFPLPPEVQQGDDEVEMAGFRNQLAFDFLRGDYSLVSDVGGMEATTNVSANLSKLIDYTVKVYNTFRLKKPFSIVKPQINISPAPTYSDYNTQPSSCTLEHCRAKSEPGDSKVAKESSTGNGYVSSVWTSSTNFMTGEESTNAQDEEDDDWNNRQPRQVKRSNSIQRMVQRLNNNSAVQPKRVPPPEYYNQKAQDDSDDDDDDQTYFAPSNVYANPYRTISNEIRRKRLEEAEQSKVETLKVVHMLQSRKKEMRDEERAKEREQFIKAVRAQQLNEPAPETSTANFSTVESDDFFNEYNMRLWRKSRPSMDERTKFLEGKLSNSGLERNGSFCEPKKLEPPKPGLFRSATEKQIKSQALPSSVQWLRKTNKVAETIEKELAKGHGHVSLNASVSEKDTKDKTPEPTAKKISSPLNNIIRKPGIKTAAERPKSMVLVPSIQEKPQAEDEYSMYLKALDHHANKLQKSPTTASISSKRDPSSTKKNEISEYLKAKDLMKSKSTVFKPMQVRKEPSPPPAKVSSTSSSTNKSSQNSIIMQAKKNCEADKKVKLKSTSSSDRASLASKSSIPSQVSKSTPHKPFAVQNSRSSYEIKKEPPKPAFNRQTTLDEFNDLLSEADECLAELDPKELDHLAEWVDNTFSTTRGVECD